MNIDGSDKYTVLCYISLYGGKDISVFDILCAKGSIRLQRLHIIQSCDLYSSFWRQIFTLLQNGGMKEQENLFFTPDLATVK